MLLNETEALESCVGTVAEVEITVEPRFNDIPRERANYIVKLGYRYSRIPCITILWENF